MVGSNGSFADCDMDGNSCETRTNSLTDCGGCGVPCLDVLSAPSAPAALRWVRARPVGDCDGNPKNIAVETGSLQHAAAATWPATKLAAAVVYGADCSAMPSRADCDRDEASCEIDLRSDGNNCGACDASASST